MKESRPLAIAILLAVLCSAAHSPTLLMTPGYPVRAGGCPVVSLTALFATIHPSMGFAAVHGLGLALASPHSPTLKMIPSYLARSGGCWWAITVRILLSSLGFAGVHGLGFAVHSQTPVIPGYPTGAGAGVGACWRALSLII